jgi:two-component sensor histidine kinase
VSCSASAVLLLDGKLHVVAASVAFCATFVIPTADVVGRALAEVGSGEFARPQLQSLLTGTLAGFAEVSGYEMKLAEKNGDERTLVLTAKKLDYGAGTESRMLLSVFDVSAARRSEALKDALLREKEVLLREIEHRVANSLQIIASILMQSARKVGSEEARAYLRSAHDRVLSIAAIQRHLTSAQLGQVPMATYLRQLCQSLEASMVRDPILQSIVTDIDASSLGGDQSISIGLIVTELVINALKHAFPGGEAGRIDVGFHANSNGWLLSVKDNGIGMPRMPSAKAGLGSTIVEALAKRLDADVTVIDEHPGTSVLVAHSSSSSGPKDHMSAI